SLFKNRGILVEDHYFSKFLILTNVLQSVFFKSKIVVLVHLLYGYDSKDNFFIRKFINKVIEKFRLSFADLIITSSEYSKIEIVSLGINPKKNSVLSPGIDRDKFQISYSNEQSDKKDSKHILCVANYIPRKGIIYLIEALSHLRKEYLILHLVGNRKNNSSYYKKLNNTVEKLNITERVIFHDGADQENLKKLYASADIFVLPSLKETFGIVFLEAMHHGLPIVTTNVSAMPELIEEGRNGFLVPPSDSQALAQAILRLIEQPNLIKQMGEAGHEKVANSYYWEDTCSKFVFILQNMEGV
ncbi:MAG: glycosyltransferase family 4 protein, partial [Rivularia sp. ALOHA_DT_140]|nr:glycosyltransferase family 4 protein [Rivularia sp. ALOHA_DT_140]